MQDLFSDLEVLSALIASAMHDVDHRGVSNQYHCSNCKYNCIYDIIDLMTLYNDLYIVAVFVMAQYVNKIWIASSFVYENTKSF